MHAMSGWDLVADFYGLGKWVEYRTKRTRADGADSQADMADGADGVDSIILGGIQDWGGQADAADYRILDGADWGGRGRLADWQTGRTMESWTRQTGGGRGGLGWTSGWGKGRPMGRA